MTVLYSNDLIDIISKNSDILNEIKLKLQMDNLINQGLFLMSTTYFEATLRDVMNKILISKPEKLKKDNFTISKDNLSSLDDSAILKSIIENELFNLFKGNVKEQLLYIIEIVSNIRVSNIVNKSKHEDLINIINRCSDISYYRNCLIHNAGKTNNGFNKKIHFYKNHSSNLFFSKDLIENFINDYLKLFDILRDKIIKNTEFKQKTRIEQLRQLWSDCFDSPILVFDDYWEIDEDRDLIIDVKYPDCERGLSSGEKVYLSIWRHQYYDAIKTEEFLICSVDVKIIYKIYKGLSDVKFYYMYQQSRDL
ncbi:hypothetical protein PAE9249_05156 [Paenibacillus sp. CECT 9249]|uniref:hypothetical protein n=1 Tax=Paenibacillus sp. CECT 9249 TaxID=2845385 RepID=UPI001E327346|nr:hypothetical protein [Paenibacillus sp. CECT 9249]CAH0122584.1 hypothetical protein PAE9249_05156 [Paenibacillus sp. CECT 9249]